MENITNFASELKSNKFNKVRKAEKLLNLGFSAKEIKDELNVSKEINKNKILGFALIAVSIVIYFYRQVHYVNFFKSGYLSEARLLLLNESLLKPTIVFSLIVLGVNLIVNRLSINKGVKAFFIIILGAYSLFVLSYNAIILPFIFGIIALILICFVKLPTKHMNIEMENIFPYISKSWKGSSIYIFIIFGAVLIYYPYAEYIFVKSNNNYLANFANTFLSLTQKLLFYGGLLIALLLSFNFSKFKISLYPLIGLSIVTIGVAIFQKLKYPGEPSFDLFSYNMINGSVFIIISAITFLVKNKTFANKVKKITSFS